MVRSYLGIAAATAGDALTAATARDASFTRDEIRWFHHLSDHRRLPTSFCWVNVQLFRLMYISRDEVIHKGMQYSYINLWISYRKAWTGITHVLTTAFPTSSSELHRTKKNQDSSINSLRVPCNENRCNNVVVLSGYLASANASLVRRCLKIATQKPSRIHMFFKLSINANADQSSCSVATSSRWRPQTYDKTKFSKVTSATLRLVKQHRQWTYRRL